MAVPIWKDKYISLGSSDVYLYRVRLGNSSGTIIYTGRAYKRPSASEVSVRINGICADYLSQSLPSLDSGIFTPQTIEQAFYVEKSTDGTTFSAAETVTFNMDWSYDYGFDVATQGLSHPITGEVAKNQFILFTTPSASSVSVVYMFNDGATLTQTIEITRLADFNDDFNLDFAKTARAASAGTAVINLQAMGDIAEVTIGGVTYKVLQECYDYALHYVNAYGGWDTLLIKGLTKKTDNYTRHSIGVDYDNTDISNRGTRNYANEVARVFDIRTGWMLGDAGSRMHHLLGSTEVYLYDFTEDQMIPVTIDDTSCEYKTFQSEGNKLVSYTLTATEAHEMIRK